MQRNQVILQAIIGGTHEDRGRGGRLYGGRPPGAPMRSMPEVEVVGVADVRPETAGAGAAMVGARPYASYEALVAAEDVELVDVCLPTPLPPGPGAPGGAGGQAPDRRETAGTRPRPTPRRSWTRSRGARGGSSSATSCGSSPSTCGSREMVAERGARDGRRRAHEPPVAFPDRVGTTGTPTGG